MRLACSTVVAALAASLASVAHAAAPARVVLDAPVDSPLARRFEAPDGAWGPGHRGVDFAAATGTTVGAAAPGRVVFAGRVASVLAVTVDHGGGVETTYSDLASVAVSEGDDVARGAPLGTAGHAHAGVGGVHLGVLVRDRYVDPEPLLRADAGSVRLVPLRSRPDGLARARRAVAAALAAAALGIAGAPSAPQQEEPPPPGGMGG